MAIQQINLGSMPLGAGGDSQRAANTKTNENFSNTSHAASRLVGGGENDVSDNKQAFKNVYSLNTHHTGNSLNAISAADRGVYNASSAGNPTSGNIYVETKTVAAGSLLQVAMGFSEGGLSIRRKAGSQDWSSWTEFRKKDAKLLEEIENELTYKVVETAITPGGESFDSLGIGELGYSLAMSGRGTPSQNHSSNQWYEVRTERGHGTAPEIKRQIAYERFSTGSFIRTNSDLKGTWGDWVPLSANKHTYYTTTATAANVNVSTDGILRRSSSSEKYKDILSDLELDDEHYSKTMQIKPIIYRSKAELDPKNWHFISFSAEALGAIEPALTQWKTHETVVDEDTGEQRTVELEQKEAEGINLNAICAVLHATNIYQDKKLKELEQRLTALESNNEPIE